MPVPRNGFGGREPCQLSACERTSRTESFEIAAVYHTDETIAAIASAAGGPGRGIVRLSGPAVIPIIERASGQHPKPVRLAGFASRPRWRVRSSWSNHHSTRSGGFVSVAVRPELYPAAGRGDPCSIGSPPLLSAILRTVCAHRAVGRARRVHTAAAFLAGRLDLTQAEAVLGVIDARGQSEFESARSNWPAA